MLECIQFALYLVQHLACLCLRRAREGDADPAFRALQHEADLALAVDRHDRIGDRTDSDRREMRAREFPAIGKLTGHEFPRRSEERRVGTEWVSPGRSRWSQDN